MIVDIQTIKPIETDTFGKCLLVETYPIIDSPFGFGGCVDLTKSIKLLYPNTQKNKDYLNEAKHNEDEYFEFSENGAFSIENVPGIGRCYVHNSFNETTNFFSEEGNAIDLGLSVLWADKNVGASSPSEYGKLYGYGDTSGEKWSEDENDYPKSHIIRTSNDIATSNWGKEWRMPSVQELEELAKKCQWKEVSINDILGIQAIGPNGNSIFFPYAGSRIGINTYRAGQMGECWAGTLSNFGSPVNMLFFGYSASLNYGACPAWGASVRPVKDK